ncbi:MAG: hypothetical protein IPJ71_01260 [Bdellovibrionales bacterium]|nr:hypothetical protein [Bdellovibrionales bacterium]
MLLWNRTDLLECLKKNTSQQGRPWLQWALTERQEDRQEFYLIQSMTQKVVLDQSREVEDRSFNLRLYVRRSDGNKMGVAEGPLFQKLDLQGQLEELEKKALLGVEREWLFPKSDRDDEESQPPLKVYPPLLAEIRDCSFRVYRDLEKAIQRAAEGQFNSGELFVIREHRVRTLSSGFSTEQIESKIYAEVCFSSQDKESGLSEEFLVTRWACHPEQLDFDKMCRESAQFAQASLRTERPASGEIHVLLHADVLNSLFHDVLSQLSSRQKYYQMPFKPKGSSLIEDFKGMPFVMRLDPTLDYCFGSGSFSSEGLSQRNKILVQDNKIQFNPTSSQMSQYLGDEVTTVLGNLVIVPSKLESKDSLIKSEDKVLEILQFSGLFTNSMDLTYSSEIRLARLYDNRTGKVSYIKGGNLSGHFPTNFSSVLWGGDAVVENWFDESGGHTYFGPEVALIGNVSVTS